MPKGLRDILFHDKSRFHIGNRRFCTGLHGNAIPRSKRMWVLHFYNIVLLQHLSSHVCHIDSPAIEHSFDSIEENTSIGIFDRCNFFLFLHDLGHFFFRSIKNAHLQLIQ